MPVLVRPVDVTQFQLSVSDPADTHGMGETECEQILSANRLRIAEFQNVLYAGKERSLLLVLQAMDTAGKDPIIRDVLSAANSQACRVTAFQATSKSEERRDRMWRFHTHVPAAGEIGVFNRSYYDEIIAADAHGELDAAEAERRYDQIRCFEQMLSADGVEIIKLFLHISKDEQRRRLQERIDDSTRHWELSEADFRERQYWDGYMRAYESAICRTQAGHAPWYVITSDRKWFRDAAASELIAETLEGMDLEYPPAKVDLSKVEWH